MKKEETNYIRVNDLKKILNKINGNPVIILSKDGEGNNFSPLSDINTNSVYVPYSTWFGEIGLKKLTKELEEQGYSEEDLIEGEDALILWPIN